MGNVEILRNIRHLQIILIGSDRKGDISPLTNFARISLELGLEVKVILDSRRHSNEDSTCNALNSMGVKYKLLEELSLESLGEVDTNTIGLSVNSQWIFTRSEIDCFSGALFNYHSADLPRRRGRAAHTWRYLENMSRTTLTFHQIEERLDSGRKVSDLEVIDDMNGMQEFYASIENAESRAFLDFIKAIQTGHWKEKTAPEEPEEDFYWPGINSEQQGYINWAWTSEEIVLMCKAMGKPHAGAKSFIGGQPISIRAAELLPGDAAFHPFQAGLVIKITKDFVAIAAKGRGLRVPRNMIVTKHRIRLGEKIRTPSTVLDLD